jgi:uncharacterized protein YhaN
MTYKGMFLSALLVPVAITSYAKNTVDSKVSVEAQIEQLKEKRYQKQLELSELGIKIAEKQELLEDMYDDACSAWTKMLDSLELEDQEREDFIQEKRSSSEEFKKLLKYSLEVKKDVNGLLVGEILDEEKPFPSDFNFSKFWVLRGRFEYDLLVTFIERYEACLQELIEIDSEMEVLLK